MTQSSHSPFNFFCSPTLVCICLTHTHTSAASSASWTHVPPRLLLPSLSFFINTTMNNEAVSKSVSETVWTCSRQRDILTYPLCVCVCMLLCFSSFLFPCFCTCLGCVHHVIHIYIYIYVCIYVYMYDIHLTIVLTLFNLRFAQTRDTAYIQYTLIYFLFSLF